LGENISKPATLVVSGAAAIGMVALSLALSPTLSDKGRYMEVPAPDYSPIEQACVIMKASQHKQAAQAFLNFIQSPASSELFRKYGFSIPRE
jgi:molybdate transport system substrate-binding protein